jgi:hypothetical protein
MVLVTVFQRHVAFVEQLQSITLKTSRVHDATLSILMCSMGAIMASGLLDAGGRNATMGLKSRSGYFRRTAVVGLAVFVQYW